MSSHTNIILVSSHSTDAFPENTSSKFSNHLSHSLILNKNLWEVGLNSVHMENLFDASPPEEVLSKKQHFVFSSRTEDSDKNEHYLTIEPTIKSVSSLFALMLKARKRWHKITENVFTAELVSDDQGNDHLLIAPSSLWALWIEKSVVDWFKIIPQEDGIIGENGNTYYYFSAGVTLDGNNGTFSIAHPEEIRIVMEELSPIIGHTGHKKILSVMPYAPSDRLDKIFARSFEGHEYTTLHSSEITSFSIKLTDERDRLLNLSSTRPSVIVLNARLKAMDGFLMTITSDDSKALFHNNTNSAFTCGLPHPLYFSGHWQVSLSSARLISQIDVSYCMNRHDFYLKFVSILENLSVLTALEGFIYGEGGPKQSAPVGSVICFDNIEIFEPEDFMKIQQSDAVADCIMQPTFSWKDTGIYVSSVIAGSVIIPPKMNKFLGGREVAKSISMTGGGDATFLGMPDISSLTPDALFIHTNFSSPVIMGDTHAPIVKTLSPQIWRESTPLAAKIWRYESLHLNYVGVCQSELTFPTISVRDHYGTIVKFNNNYNTSFTFIFKKIN